MDELTKIEAKRQEIDTQYEMRVIPELLRAQLAVQALLISVDELLDLVRKVKNADG